MILRDGSELWEQMAICIFLCVFFINQSKVQYAMVCGSFISLFARFLIRKGSVLLGFKLFLDSLRIDHPSNQAQSYLAALEKVEALTPLILPSLSSCSLILLGCTQVSLVVEVYLTSLGNSMPLWQLPLLQFSVIFPQVFAQRFSDFTAGIYPTQPGTWESMPPDPPSCCSAGQLAGTQPMQPTIGAFFDFTSIIFCGKLQIIHFQKQNLSPGGRASPFRPIPNGISVLRQERGLDCSLQYLIEAITMDIDFILFTPPRVKYSLVDFWGQTIFITRTRPRQKNQNSLASFLNCYKATHTNEVHLTIDAALLQAKGTLQLDNESTTEATSSIEEEVMEKYIPCLFLNSMVGSRYLIFYLHASGEDIKLTHKMLDLLRNLYQVNVIAMEYPGYSIYKGSPSSETIKEDSAYVYNHIVNRMGFKQQNIIVMGRSIGTGVALQLMNKATPGALVLISPFSSVKSLARERVGILGGWLAKQTYDNKMNIQRVTCPTFFLHGHKDDVVSPQNTAELARLCIAKKQVMISPDMTHSTFDFYSDLADPLREFLMNNHFSFYEPNQQGPILPDSYFQFPEGVKL